MNIFKLSTLSILSVLLTACGGGGTSETSPTGGEGTPAAVVAPGGVYVGYYMEDATTNPEDPTAGALYLNLPANDAPFAGSMSFTYVGCQTFNVGAINGNKSGLDLSGTWSGAVDGRPQSGQYAGKFNTTEATYRGTYTNSGGKQLVDIPNCISYYIGPNGRWELFPIGRTVTTGQTATGVIIEGNQITWYPPAGGNADSLLSIIDQSVAASGGANAIVWQNIYNAGISTATLPPSVSLVQGRQYVVSAGSIGDTAREYFSSRLFTAP